MSVPTTTTTSPARPGEVSRHPITAPPLAPHQHRAPATSRVRAAASWPSWRGGGPRPGHGRGWSVSVVTAATSLGPGLHLPRLLCCAGVTCGAAPAGSGTQVASSLCQPGRRSRATSGTTSRGPAVASSPPSRAHRDSRPATGTCDLDTPHWARQKMGRVNREVCWLRSSKRRRGERGASLS